MSAIAQWGLGLLGLLVTVILFAIGELIVTSRDTDKRIGTLERMQDRHDEALMQNQRTLKRLIDEHVLSGDKRRTQQ